MTGRLIAADRWLMGCGPRTQRLAIALVTVGLGLACLGYVPRAYINYDGLPLLRYVAQPAEYGTDTIADMYEAKVVLHDWRDMYTKTGVEQTPLEARTWSKEASAPYPPAALLIEAALYWIGERTGIGFYGLILALAALFAVQVARYSLATRWYVFVLIGVCGLYFGQRFVYVQDGSYLILLVIVMSALSLARRGSAATDVLMALGTAVKLSPLYYIVNLPRMKPSVGLTFVVILGVALVVPYAVFDNYLYIYTFQSEIKGGFWQTVGAVAISLPFTVLLTYVSVRRGFDLEDRVGWGVVPVAMFLAFKLNVARHLLVVLLLPDKRARRTLAAAVSIAMYYVSFGALRLNSTLPLCAALLYGIVIYELTQVGWDVVRDDLRHPVRTAQTLIGKL